MPFRTVYDLIIILLYQLVPSLLSSKLVLCKLNFILKYLYLVTFLLVIGSGSSGGILHNLAVYVVNSRLQYIFFYICLFLELWQLSR